MTCEAEGPRDEDTTEDESSELIWTNNAPNSYMLDKECEPDF
jgi:hypothetical protein